MKRKLGYLFFHAPDPENLGEYITYRIAVEEETYSDDKNAEDDGEGCNEQD